MAKINNDLLDGAQGAVGKQLVFRERGGQTFVSKYPDMSNVKPSEKQLKEKGRFGDAVRFAQGIINDPVKKANYKVKKGKSVYHTAIKDYMAENK
ncbi:MAG: hypothetical protein ABI480_09950 [Chitinophagaceae bacterium]